MRFALFIQVLCCVLILPLLRGSEMLIESYEYNSEQEHSLAIQFNNPYSRHMVLYGWVRFATFSELDTVLSVLSIKNEGERRVFREGKSFLDFNIQKKSDLETKEQTYYMSFITPYTFQEYNGSQNHLPLRFLDFNVWAFFAISVNSEQKRMQCILRFPKRNVSHSYPLLTPFISDKQELHVGGDQATSFQGSLQRVIINDGRVLDDEDSIASLMLLNPSSMPRCSIIYSECGFTGYYSTVCTRYATKVISSVKSVFLVDSNPVRQCVLENNFSEIVAYSKTVVCIEFDRKTQVASVEEGITTKRDSCLN